MQEQKRPGLLRANNWILHSDNTRPRYHRALLTHEFPGKKDIVPLSHPPLFARFITFSFPKWKYSPKVTVLTPLVWYRANCRRFPIHLWKTTSRLDSPKKCQERWDLGIAAQCDYFGGGDDVKTFFKNITSQELFNTNSSIRKIRFVISSTFIRGQIRPKME